jgi:hypothetical protein
VLVDVPLAPSVLIVREMELVFVDTVPPPPALDTFVPPPLEADVE